MRQTISTGNSQRRRGDARRSGDIDRSLKNRNGQAWRREPCHASGTTAFSKGPVSRSKEHPADWLGPRIRPAVVCLNRNMGGQADKVATTRTPAGTPPARGLSDSGNGSRAGHLARRGSGCGVLVPRPFRALGCVPSATWLLRQPGRQLLSAARAFSSASSMLKLAGFWRGGNSSKVLRNSPTMRLRRHEQERAVGHPLVVEHGRVLVAALERIAAQVVELRDAQRDERLLPDAQARGALLHERGPSSCSYAQRHQVAVVAPVEEALARILLHLALQERQQVVAVDVDLEGLVARPCGPS